MTRILILLASLLVVAVTPVKVTVAEIIVPDWTSPNWGQEYLEMDTARDGKGPFGTSLGSIKLAGQWGFMSGIREECGEKRRFVLIGSRSGIETGVGKYGKWSADAMARRCLCISSNRSERKDAGVRLPVRRSQTVDVHTGCSDRALEVRGSETSNRRRDRSTSWHQNNLEAGERRSVRCRQKLKQKRLQC